MWYRALRRSPDWSLAYRNSDGFSQDLSRDDLRHRPRCLRSGGFLLCRNSVGPDQPSFAWVKRCVRRRSHWLLVKRKARPKAVVLTVTSTPKPAVSARSRRVPRPSGRRWSPIPRPVSAEGINWVSLSLQLPFSGRRSLMAGIPWPFRPPAWPLRPSSSSRVPHMLVPST